MLILPAIDLLGGQCVRLRRGDYAHKTVFSDDPVAVARRWVQAGAVWLHVVDLDGAKAGRPVNLEVVGRIARAVEARVEVGGGLRGEADIRAALQAGASRVILGTAALESPPWCAEVCARFPGRIALGLDARAGRVALRGWQDDSPTDALDLARRLDGVGLAAVIYTDIARDGMMQGPNFEGIARLKEAIGTPVIAAGGITTLDDVRHLVALNIAGAIIGRALYEGTIVLADALQAAGPQHDT